MLFRSVHETPQARILEWVAFPSPGDLPNPGIDGSPTGSPVPGILQARTLEWVAVSLLSREYRSSLRIRILRFSEGGPDADSPLGEGS